jgi:hypothetical protein
MMSLAQIAARRRLARLSTDQVHEVVRDVLGARLGMKSRDVSHVFIIIGARPETGLGTHMTSGACVHYSGPVGECDRPAHGVIALEMMAQSLRHQNPDIDEQIEHSRKVGLRGEGQVLT